MDYEKMREGQDRGYERVNMEKNGKSDMDGQSLLEESSGQSKRKKTLLEIIIKRNDSWIEHIMRGKQIITMILEGILDEKRKRGRKCLKMVYDVKNINYTTKEMALIE